MGGLQEQEGVNHSGDVEQGILWNSLKISNFEQSPSSTANPETIMGIIQKLAAQKTTEPLGTFLKYTYSLHNVPTLELSLPSEVTTSLQLPETDSYKSTYSFYLGDCGTSGPLHGNPRLYAPLPLESSSFVADFLRKIPKIGQIQAQEIGKSDVTIANGMAPTPASRMIPRDLVQTMAQLLGYEDLGTSEYFDPRTFAVWHAAAARLVKAGILSLERGSSTTNIRRYEIDDYFDTDNVPAIERAMGDTENWSKDSAKRRRVQDILFQEYDPGKTHPTNQLGITVRMPSYIYTYSPMTLSDYQKSITSLVLANSSEEKVWDSVVDASFANRDKTPPLKTLQFENGIRIYVGRSPSTGLCTDHPRGKIAPKG